jgi:plastocyanin
MKLARTARHGIIASRLLLFATVVSSALALVVVPNSAETAPTLVSVRGMIELVGSKTKSREGGALRNDASGVVVWMEAADGRTQRTVRSRRLMRQQSKRFIPHVLATEVGTEVDFPNEDPFFHNVFSIFNGRRFDLGLYASGETRPVAFNRPGISYIFCNIHPQMSAVVLALETPHHAVSDTRGAFAIDGVPEGRYRVEFWHERSTQELLATLTREVQIGAAGIDLGTVRVSEEGFVPMPHRNKHGDEYDVRTNLPSYRKP